MKAVKQGACDFITKPFKAEALILAMERAFEDREMRREIVRLRSARDPNPDGDLVGRSPAMARVIQLARRAARGNATVLITGESGTGKGALARFIHDQGPNHAGPFVQVNCAALPAHLVEAELFGAKKGAYTDAREDRPGLFAQAAGGTLMLDEIGEMPLETQPKLLHALETGKVRPVGGTREVETPTRVVAATNALLETAVKERRFREDLYYRLNVITLDMPPLRQRREDIEPLTDVLLQRACTKLGREVFGLSGEAMAWILTQPWPGNVRELANALERAVALTEHDTIVLEDLRVALAVPQQPDLLSHAAAQGLPLADVEQMYIERVLAAVGGNRVQAARLLGIDRRTLQRKLGTAEER